MLLREGRWGDRQVVPREYVAHAARRSPYNPHYPYSLQFSVNTEGEIGGLPRDAFWKAGSGGHAFYVVPSLALLSGTWGAGRSIRAGEYRDAPASRRDAQRRSAGWVEGDARGRHGAGQDASARHRVRGGPTSVLSAGSWKLLYAACAGT